MRYLIFVAAIAIAGYVSLQLQWKKADASQEDFNRDYGQCMKVTSQTPSSGHLQQQQALVSCMNGKGWYRR